MSSGNTTSLGTSPTKNTPQLQETKSHAEPKGQGTAEENDHHGVAHAQADLEAIADTACGCRLGGLQMDWDSGEPMRVMGVDVSGFVCF